MLTEEEKHLLRDGLRRLAANMRHAGQVRSETVDVENVSALEPCAGVDDGQSAAGVAANQLGGQVDVGVGEGVRRVANLQRTISRSPPSDSSKVLTTTGFFADGSRAAAC
jgi:hypothetical protein